jgi:aminoglycoside phosphotransferase (APT) family kinase protein
MSAHLSLEDDAARALGEALPDWAGVAVREVGRGANSAVFQATRGDEAVAVHLELGRASAGVGGAELAEAKYRAAQDAFAASGLAPRVLVRTDACSVEAWGGETLTTLRRGVADARAAGELLGRIHQLPTAWFEPFREAVCAAFPRFRDVPPGSPVWSLVCNRGGSSSDGVFPQLCELGADEFRRFLELVPAPRTAALSRVVTTHGDYHAGNIVERDGVLRAIDFDQACVCGAVQDLSFRMDQWASLYGVEGKRSFVAGYLSTAGGAEAVDAVILDVECCYVNYRRYNGSRQHAQLLLDHLAVGADRPAAAAALAAAARDDPAVARCVVERVPYGIPKEVVAEGAGWGNGKLYSRRLGREDTLGWWNAPT